MLCLGWDIVRYGCKNRLLYSLCCTISFCRRELKKDRQLNREEDYIAQVTLMYYVLHDSKTTTRQFIIFLYQKLGKKTVQIYWFRTISSMKWFIFILYTTSQSTHFRETITVAAPIISCIDCTHLPRFRQHPRPMIILRFYQDLQQSLFCVEWWH